MSGKKSHWQLQKSGLLFASPPTAKPTSLKTRFFESCSICRQVEAPSEFSRFSPHPNTKRVANSSRDVFLFSSNFGKKKVGADASPDPHLSRESGTLTFQWLLDMHDHQGSSLQLTATQTGGLLVIHISSIKMRHEVMSESVSITAEMPSQPM